MAAFKSVSHTTRHSFEPYQQRPKPNGPRQCGSHLELLKELQVHFIDGLRLHPEPLSFKHGHELCGTPPSTLRCIQQSIPHQVLPRPTYLIVEALLARLRLLLTLFGRDVELLRNPIAYFARPGLAPTSRRQSRSGPIHFTNSACFISFTDPICRCSGRRATISPLRNACLCLRSR